jgi:hypothetical protein
VSRLKERGIALGIVAIAVVAGAIALAPELDVARVDLNDSVFHFTIIDALVQRLAAGRSVLDFWMPEWSFGFPVVRDYQPLGHWLVVLAHFATLRQFPVIVVFTFVRWLLLALFPLTVYAGCRMMSIRPLTAAAAALLAPLIAAPNLYGIDYGSYIWRGNGLYTQLVAMHLFVLAVGAGCRAIRGGRRITLAGLLLALTFLAHFIYGYMAATTLILAAAIPGTDAAPRRRFLRLGWVALLSIIVSAFQIVPMLGDGPFINRSRWEPEWKWQSFGASEVLSLTASGDLLDGNRLPVVSLLALAGAIVVLRRRRDAEEERFAWLFAFCGALLWIFLLCGRAAWGPFFTVIGLSQAAQLHRFIGGAQWFLLILAAIGLSQLWMLPLQRRWRYPALAAVALTIIVLWLPIDERRQFLQEGYGWGRENLAAFADNQDAVIQVTRTAARLGGRSYPGLAGKWGMQLRVGYVPLYAFLSEAHVPAVAFLYHAMALPADVMVRFDDTRLEQYRLFDIRSVVADAGRAMPPFLKQISTAGPFRIYQPPPSDGAFDLVRAPYAYHVDGRTFFDVNDAWLNSGWPAARAHLLLDYESAVPAVPRPRLPSLAPLAQPPPVVSCGAVRGTSDAGDEHLAQFDVARGDCFALFKMTYHRNWKATVDGGSRPVVMLSPGFVGVPLTPGRHSVVIRYDAGPGKAALLLLAIPILVGAFLVEKRGLLARLETRAADVPLRWKPEWTWAVVTFVLVLPCIAPYAGSSQPNGHDALEYMPRVVEFHENLRHGILMPRWAPDLSSGQGQPLFLFNPPLFYYATEVFHVAGLSFSAAMNAACIALILAAAASMFLLGRWYFGAPGGAIAALAYVWAPYFLVDLYVRTAFAEFSAFPFYPLAFYGFARHAATRDRKYLLLGALAYAAVWFAHSPAAVLLSPVVVAFILFLSWRAKSFRLLLTHAGALAAGLLLAATIWLPSLVETADTHANLLTVGPLRYSNHYVAPWQFFSTMWGYGVSIAGDQDTMPFSLGWPMLILAGIAAIAIVRREAEEWQAWLAFFAGAVFVLCFLMTQRAHGVWDAWPQLQYVAFPWRLLAPASFCLALLSAAIVLPIARLQPRLRNAAFAAVIASIVLIALPHAKPAGYLSLDETLWTPRDIAAGNVVAATFDTFEPRWVQVRPRYNGTAVVVTRGNASTSLIDRTPARFVASIRAVTTADVELPIAWFPGWHARIDGVDQPLDDPSPMGRIRLSVAPGAHRLDASFERTPIRWTADLTSVAALLAFAGAIAFGRSAPAAMRVAPTPAPLPLPMPAAAVESQQVEERRSRSRRKRR